MRNLGHPLIAEQIPIQLLSWLVADVLAAGTGGWMSFVPIVLIGCPTKQHRSTQLWVNSAQVEVRTGSFTGPRHLWIAGNVQS